jgi:2-polyprenyl-3-methyl-5-hydroxy-6-metoxy-1,4-benzoquinol methylase
MGVFSHPRGYRYEGKVDLHARNSPHAELVRLVGRGKRVLEVGPGAGHVTEALASQSNSVTCIELNPEMESSIAPLCERVIIGDIETMDLAGSLGAAKFDVVTFGDVLEHLKDPVGALKRFMPFLSVGGCIVASIPNVAHRSVRYSLLCGDFTYKDEGILDRSHLRFFTWNTIQCMFQEVGCEIDEVVRIKRTSFMDWESKKAAPFLERLMRESLKVAMRMVLRKDALTYQFVVRAKPADSDR